MKHDETEAGTTEISPGFTYLFFNRYLQELVDIGLETQLAFIAKLIKLSLSNCAQSLTTFSVRRPLRHRI